MDDTTSYASSLSRRAFGAASFGVGFAVAAGPVAASAIMTDTSGIEAGMVQVPTADGKMPAYRARPKGVAHPPVILVVQEIFGLHEWIRDVCRRFAKQGFYAIAGAHYWRRGDPVNYTDIQKLVSELVTKVSDNEVLHDLDAEVKFARAEHADIKKLSITGFCWGGRVVWLYAAHNPALTAGVAWYGRVAGGNPTPLQPMQPVQLVEKIHAPVLGLYGFKDTGITQDSLEQMRAALKAAGNSESRIDVFQNSGHGFFADYRESYNEADAKDAWGRALAWLKAHGAS